MKHLDVQKNYSGKNMARRRGMLGLISLVFSLLGTTIFGTPIEISTWEDLHNVRTNLTGSYILMNNLGPESTGYDTYASASANSGAGWEPIGGNDTTSQFTGSFDGGGYVINGLRINRPDAANVGLFGHIGRDDPDGVEIKNLGLNNVQVVGGRGTGTLVGRVTGDINTLIEACFADNGSVTGDGATGGLVGSNNSYVENPGNEETHYPLIAKSWADIAVSWSQAGDGDKLGGLAGCNQKGRIRNSYARGPVTVDNSGNQDNPTPERVGGLAGCITIRGYIENSYSTGAVTTEGTVNNVGGFVGKGGGGGSDGDAVDSFWDTETSGQETSSPTSGCTGKNTTEMKDQDTFTDTTTEGLEESWDFSTIWTIDTTGEINDGYPYLQENEPTLAVISAVRSRIENGVAMISWDVELEMDTMGYFLERWADGAWLRINETMIDSRFWELPPITYEQADPEAPLGTTQRYRIVEMEGSGRLRIYGPYDLELDGGEVSWETWAAGIDWGDADSSPDADPDGDGMSNFQEYLAGTDPLNANCVLQVRRLTRTGNGFLITWQSRPGFVYAIQFSQSLKADFMTIIPKVEAGEGTETTVSLPVPDPESLSFFRVIVVTPKL